MNKPLNLALTGWRLVAGTALTALLTACSSSPTAHEQAMGRSVREALARQAVQPAGPSVARGAQTTDGVIAAHGIDRYEQSYQRPPAPASVLNILTGPTAGMGAASGMPR